MHPQVLERFREFSVRFEGCVVWPYLDIKGLVTVGIGNLIDPLRAALELPWVLADTGLPASRERVTADWSDLKAQQRLSQLHYSYARAVTKIRLTAEGVNTLVRGKLLANENFLRKAFPAFAEWPADAQLCAFSMAWAVGPGFPAIFKNFTQFANQGDWEKAAQCAAIRTEGNPGIVPRNAANLLCLHNAQTVRARGLDVSKLYWPGVPDPASEPARQLQTEARATLTEWRGVPYRFPDKNNT